MERDIHSCNFERLALTKKIEKQNKQLEELYSGIEDDKMKKAKNKRKRLKPMLDSIQSSYKQSKEPSSKRKRDDSSPVGNSRRTNQKKRGNVKKSEAKKKRKKSVAASNGGNFVFKNGRIERAFRINNK